MRSIFLSETGTLILAIQNDHKTATKVTKPTISSDTCFEIRDVHNHEQQKQSGDSKQKKNKNNITQNKLKINV